MDSKDDELATFWLNGYPPARAAGLAASSV